MIVIVDIEMGNLGSILNMLKKVKVDAQISSDRKVIAEADKLVLPGVGAFDNAMEALKSKGLIDTLNHKILDEKTPILGICLGLQLFSKRSEEGTLEGLGWLNAETIRFRFNNGNDNGLKVPHMGWNTVQLRGDPGIFKGIDEPRFYFVHSYYLVCKNQEDVLTTTQYGYDFVSSIHHDNIWGTQFHPEKSHKFGMKIFSNFVEMR